MTGIDLDEEPLKIAKQNAAPNQVRVKFTQADAFENTSLICCAGKQFDIVVLDPPKLIRNCAELEDGTRKHLDLNRLAMQLVRPGGMMLTCSCAGLLQCGILLGWYVLPRGRRSCPASSTPIRFRVPCRYYLTAERPPAIRSRRICPESEYLKAMWLRL